jgi:hypothetical protein
MSHELHDSVPSIDWAELERGLTGLGPASASVLDRRGSLLEEVATDPAALSYWIVEHPQRFATTMGWCDVGYEIVRQLSQSLSQGEENRDG